MTKLKEVIGIIKDKASQGKAAIFSKRATLSLLRATTHDSFTPPTSAHLASLISSADGSRSTASAAVKLLMERLQTTHSSAVALKCLMVVHHIIKHGTFILRDQLSVYPYTGGRNYLNLSNFRDKSSAVSWELSSWVRWYAKYVEQVLCSWRALGFLIGDKSGTGETREERVWGIGNGELLREMEALLGVIEGIGKRPHEVGCCRLVDEIVGLVEEDREEVVSEVEVRVKEMRERMGCWGFGEVVELVYLLKRLEEVEEKGTVWDSVRELREKVERMQVCHREEEEEGKSVTIHRPIQSHRFAVVSLPSSVHFLRFPSAREVKFEV